MDQRSNAMKLKLYMVIVSSLLAILVSLIVFYAWDTEITCTKPDFSVQTVLPCAEEINSVIFYKTHKTGSSTVSSILWRKLCTSNELNCFLPTEKNPGKIWDFSKLADREYSKQNPGTNGQRSPFNVWLHHVHLQDFAGESRNAKSNNYIHQLVKSPSISVSIVRRPAYRFQSAWFWYEHNKRLDMKLSSFIKQLQLQPMDQSSTCPQERLSSVLNAKFNMKYRTGLDATSEELAGHSITTDPSGFARSFNTLLHENNVYLLVCDRFDESLLMLSLLLGWDCVPHALKGNNNYTTVNQCVTDNCKVCAPSQLRFSSILYVKQKVQSYNNTLTDQDANLLDYYQPFDSLLYKKATAQLDAYIDSIGRVRFDKELKDFQTVLHDVSEYCLHECFSKTSTDILCRSSRERQLADLVLPYSQAAGFSNGEEFCKSLLRDNRENVQEAWNRRNID